MGQNDDNARNGSGNPSLERAEALLRARANSIDPTPRPGFKEALRLRVREALAVPVRRMSRLKFAAAFTPALIVLIIAVMVFQPFAGVKTVYAYDQFTLAPESSDALGVDPETAYVLESRDPVSASDIQKLLTVKTRGDVAYGVEQVSDKKIKIAFEKPLAADDVVTFGLATTTTWPNGEAATRDYDWAFQVKGDFHVVSTIPADKTGDIPLDTGIEFNFNVENIDADAFSKAFSISPAVTGHVEISRRTFVFVPDFLEPNTVYSVTLKGDLPLKESDETLGEDYAFQFETSADVNRGSRFDLSEHYQTVTPEQSVALQYSVWDPSNDALPFHAKLYRFESFDEYLAAVAHAQELDWRSGLTADDLFDTASATPTYEFDPEVVTNGGSYLLFPMSLAEGYYVADISRAGARDWALFSSSDLTAYVSRATNETLAWVNDAKTGQIVAGADVRYAQDDEHGVTNAQGIASVHAKETQGNVVEIRLGNAATALVLQSNFLVENDQGSRSWTSRSPGNGVADAYWTYLYTDRPTYKPNDTVKFWGYIEAREGGTRPTRVRADAGFDSTNVDVTPNGTFAGELTIRGAQPNFYSLNISATFPDRPASQGENIASRGISVSEYVKPAYTLSIKTDVDAAYEGDTVGYTVHGEYFEGTPVKGLELAVSSECGEQTVTLDGVGNGRGSFVCQRSDAGHGPRPIWISARPTRPEEGQVETGTTLMLFGPKIYLDADWSDANVKDGTGTVRLTVRNTQPINSWDPKTFAPTVRAGQAVSGKIVEITYTRTEVGQSYDFVRKQVVPHYNYDRNENQIGEFTAYSNAQGVVEYSFPAQNPDANYRVRLSAYDENLNVDKVEVGLWSKREFEYGGESDAISFHNDDAGDAQFTLPGYELGDQVHLSVYQNDRPFETPEGGRYLYYQAQQGIRETELSETSQYQFPFESKDIPNVSVYGVLFANGAYQQIGQMGWWYGTSGFAVNYDTSVSKLSVSVTPAQSRYAPGENVSLAVHVQDAEGRPVQAEVNLNVVDEAYYAIFPETVDPLGSLYRWVDDGVLATQVTEDLVRSDSLGAEKGGGGDRALGRFTFKDNAAFDLVRTDKDGNGTMSFTLPDNVTSWRVTAQALNADDKQAGNVQIDVDATLPFFIDPVIRDSYLKNDQPTMLIRSAGTSVGLQDPVEYAVAIPDASFETTVTAVAGDSVPVALPALELGTHEVTITAKTGDRSDTITRSVRIVPSRLVTPVVATVEGGDIGATTVVPGATDRYTDVTFMDGGMGRYYGELQTLSGWWGDRADESIARLYATRLLNDYFSEDNALPDFVSSSYAGDGVHLLPYSGDDFDLTARVALLQDTPFNEDGLRSYFRNALDDSSRELTPREQAMAFAALAALGEPVLAEFQRAAPELGDDPDVRLWVALGLQAAGDGEGARAVYRELMKGIKEKDGYLYLESDSVETTAERTALLAVLAGALNEPERDRLHDYVTNQQTSDATLPLERVLYVAKTLPNLLGNETQFSYTLRGERKTETLGKGETARVLASSEDLSKFALDVAKGSLLIVSRYDVPIVDQNGPTDDDIGLTRTYSANGTATTSFSAGQLVKVEVPYSIASSNCGPNASAAGGTPIPCETYEVTDVLPSGLAVVTPSQQMGYGQIWDEQDTCYDFPTKVEDQRVSFYVSADGDTACHNRTLTYYARVVTPGTYEAEPAYIRSTRDPNMNNHSDVQTITITP